MTSSSTRLGAIVVAIALVCLGAPAAADDDAKATASRLFREGSAAFAEGNFAEAARRFEEANRRVPNAAAVYNGGVAWEAAGDRPRAADAYQSALEMGGLAPDLAGDARKRLTALNAVLGHVDVVAPVGSMVSLAHVARAQIPVQIHVAPGDHEAVVERSDGARAAQSVHVGAGETVKVAFQAAPRAPSSSAPAASAPAAKPREADAAVSTGPGAALPLGIAALGTAAVFAGGAIYFGVSGLEARDDFVGSGRHDDELHDRAVSQRTWANVAWAAAGVSAVVGAVLLVTSLGSGAKTRGSRLQAPGSGLQAAGSRLQAPGTSAVAF